jgi:uncharacterized protein (TIGR03435 family)
MTTLVQVQSAPLPSIFTARPDPPIPGAESTLNLVFRLLTVLVVIGLLGEMPFHAHAQSEDSDRVAPAFDVVSVKPEETGGMIKMPRMVFTPDGYSAEHATVRLLINDAYGIGDKQIVGAPNWINSARFEIEARIDGASAEELSKLSVDQRKLAHQRMLQTLLEDRFKLTFHRETKDLPVYSLIIAKNGPKLHEAKPGDDYANGLKSPSGNLVGPHMMLMRLGGGQISGQGVPIEYLVQQLSSQLEMLVTDKTGLTGSYDFSLQWTPDSVRSPMFKGPEDGQRANDLGTVPEASGPSLFTALQEQLGLKLEVHKGPVETFVIDHIEPATEN